MIKRWLAFVAPAIVLTGSVANGQETPPAPVPEAAAAAAAPEATVAPAAAPAPAPLPAPPAPAPAPLRVPASSATDGGSQTSGRFGGPRQLVIGADFVLSFSSVRQLSLINIQPALDYFVARNLSVGGVVSYASIELGGARMTQIGAMPRIGYAAALGPSVSLWPRLGIGVRRMGAAGSEDSRWSLPINIFAPLLWHPAPHFFVGGGPVFETELVSRADGESADKLTQFGFLTLVGGYLGG
jgi:hypothetical protein